MPRNVRGRTDVKTVYRARAQRQKQTGAEELLWHALRNRRLAGLKFRRQHPFGPYILDYFCVEHQLVVEADGDIHLDPSQKEHDEIRSAYLEAHDLRVLRFKNEEIENNLHLVLRQIYNATHSPAPETNFVSGAGVGG